MKPALLIAHEQVPNVSTKKPVHSLSKKKKTQTTNNAG